MPSSLASNQPLSKQLIATDKTSASSLATSEKPPLRPQFWQLPLAELNTAEWEALCDGCGQCCLHKFEDIEDSTIYYTDVTCRLMDTQTARCTDYPQRKSLVPECINLAQKDASIYRFLPASCAYKRRHLGQELASWHPLIAGNDTAIIKAGISIAGRVVSERGLTSSQIEERIVEPNFF